jgi:hypothetical protein
MSTPATANPADTKTVTAAMLARAIAVPPMAWLVASTALVIAASLGYRPFMTPVDPTLPEAAAARDHLEILRQIESGADPNRANRVRRGLVRAGEYMMTPLEAAVASGRLDTIEFLQERGARVDATTLPNLVCFAKLQGAADIEAYLRRQAPADFAPRCESARLPWND